ncbi:MAG: hypothetical protein K6E19_02230 [Lachnospiraceae bacterium]|nr:hypothetical protein [Lachnospiraceae bacterium]
MGYTVDGLQREIDVKKFLEDSKELEEQKQKETFLGPSSLYRGTQDAEVQFNERFREDSAKLGKKKTWKPSDTQKEKNEKIDKAMGKTKLATAYTLDLQDTLIAREKSKHVSKGLNDDPHAKIEQKMTLLFSVKFEKRMLTTSNIKANLGEYLSIIETYEELKKIEEQGLLEDRKLNLTNRLAVLHEPMSVLTRRVESFLEKNRVKRDGSIMQDTEKAREFVYTKDEERRLLGYRTMDVDTSKNFDPAALTEKSKDINKEALMKILTEDYEKAEGTISDEEIALRAELETKDYEDIQDVYSDMSKWDSMDRIQNITLLRDHLKSCESRLEKARRFEIDPGVQDCIAELRRDIIETKACLVLAEAEAAFVLATEEEEKQQRIARVKEAEADYKQVMLRTFKSSLPLTTPVGALKLEAKVTREEAINSVSDTKNYEMKRRLRDAANVIPSGARYKSYAAIKSLLTEYANCTHYTVSQEQESRLLKEILALRATFDKADPVLIEVNIILNELTKVGTSIPEWSKIPKDLRVDAIGPLPEGKQVKDLTDEELARVDHIPEETKAGKQKGSYRNAAINTARTWVNLGADTPLFAHEPTINDLRQGKVSNCYMLASTTGLINYDPQIIKDCLKDNGDGTVTVRLYKPSERRDGLPVPMFVRIPKRIPKLITGGDILSSGAVWMQLIERAAAQVGMFRQGRHGYQSLWYGTGDEWLAMLTGTTRQKVFENGEGVSADFVVRNDTRTADQIKKDEADKLFDMMTRAQSEKKIYHAGTKSKAGPGMNDGHAYTVLGTKTIGDKRYVVLRNPYANMSRVETEDGKIEKSTYFTSSVADLTCGQFAMPLEEFIATMETVNVTDMKLAFRQEQGGDLQKIADLETAQIKKAENARRERAARAAREKAEQEAQKKAQKKAKKSKKPASKKAEKPVVLEPDESGILDEDQFMAELEKDKGKPVTGGRPGKDEKKEKKDEAPPKDDLNGFEIIDEFED